MKAPKKCRMQVTPAWLVKWIIYIRCFLNWPWSLSFVLFLDQHSTFNSRIYNLLLLLKLAVVVTFPQESTLLYTHCTSVLNLALNWQSSSRISLHLQFAPPSTCVLKEKKKCSRNLRTFYHHLMTSEYLWETQ